MARKSPLARTAEIQQAINACLQEIPGRAPSEYRILSMMGEPDAYYYPGDKIIQC